MSELKDKILEKVQGGAVDWIGFGSEFLSSLKNFVDLMQADEVKALTDAIKSKDPIEIGSVAIPIIAKYPFLQEIYYKYK